MGDCEIVFLFVWGVLGWQVIHEWYILTPHFPKILFCNEDHCPSSGTSPCGNVVFIYNGNTIQVSVQGLNLVAGNMDDSDHTQVCGVISTKSKDISSHLGMRRLECRN